MTELTVVIGAVMAVAIGCASPRKVGSGRSFSAAGDFSAANNPNGPWSYGWQAEGTQDFRLCLAKKVSPPHPWLCGWQANDFSAVPGVGFSAGAEVYHPAGTTVRPGQLWFHPGPHGENCVIRWTAPRSGRFHITGAFTGLSGYEGAPTTTTDVHVFHNNQSLFDSFINLQGHGNESAFAVKCAVNAGDTIDFTVGWGNAQHACDSTALDAVIAAVH